MRIISVFIYSYTVELFTQKILARLKKKKKRWEWGKGNRQRWKIEEQFLKNPTKWMQVCQRESFKPLLLTYIKNLLWLCTSRFTLYSLSSTCVSSFLSPGYSAFHEHPVHCKELLFCIWKYEFVQIQKRRIVIDFLGSGSVHCF